MEKQIKKKKFSEETPTQCYACEMFYSGGSCLAKIDGQIRKLCLECLESLKVNFYSK